MEFPLAHGLQKAGLPLIVTSEKLKNLCFLIDTGSTHNILFGFVYEHFKEEFKLLGDTNRIMGIKGHYKETPVIEPHSTLRELTTLPLSPCLMRLMLLRKLSTKK